MVSHDNVARAWANGRKATGHNMFTDGEIVYSYGTHFPIAYHLGTGKVLFNEDKYSSSTSKHQSYVLDMIRNRGFRFWRCNTEEIKEAINNPNEPVIITMFQEHNNFDGIMDNMHRYFQRKGVKRFPRKKIETYIQKLLTVQMI